MDYSCISIPSTFLLLFLLLVSPLQTSCRAEKFSFPFIENLGLDIFESKMRYGSGFFNIRMKLPGKNPTGIVTSFYLSSRSSNHDEIDHEFVGGPEYKLLTNIFTNGQGGIEQQIHL
ncbi:Xyloglucan endotransglucosylase/hydrolase [Melia azedarach]|uniref:Xyloglucan endotransglucosylase/hydrolase n=1 Tax=Melia azedarach TaxID=155640 RepID=A0ACC1YZ54_MELAZ|nr:Xyloglucan endotransglucosylase/hydrolase [Melia azedarach]